jgi:FixJ family two-component response regulator
VSPDAAPTVLCVDDDRDIAEIVQAVLTDEGYATSCLYSLDDDALLRTVGKLEPDCVLLDSASSGGYEEGWAEAAALHLRRRKIPVVMFTAHTADVAEAREATSPRAKAADFAAVLEKPFNLDDLIAAVASATSRSVPFDRTSDGEKARTKSLVEALQKHGATDVHPSRLREWATFRDKRGRLCQMYWWEGRGVYQLGRYQESGRMTMVGQFVDRDAAIEAALPS